MARTLPLPAITVLCLEDDPIIGLALEQAVNDDSSMLCLGVLNAADGLLADAARLRPDIVVADLTMPGLDCLTALQQLTTACPRVRAIVFSGYDDPATIDRVIEAGAWGFVSKGGSMTNVLGAIRTVAAGATAFAGDAPTRSGEARR